MDSKEKALEYFDKSYNCAQAALAGCQDLTQMDEKTALAVAGGFGGGMRCGSICGAATGAIMALGMIFPFDDSEATDAKERIGRMTMELLARFKEQNKYLDCNDLVQGDKAAAHKKICPGLIQSSVEIVHQMAKEYAKGK